MHPNKFNNCGKHTTDTIHKRIAQKLDIMIPFATPFSASCFFFSPSFKLKYADVPSPNIKAKAKPTIVNGKTTFVAPFPRYPTPQPIKIWSTILYNELTNNDIIQGIENFLINLLIFSVPKIFSSFSIFLLFLSFSF